MKKALILTLLLVAGCIGGQQEEFKEVGVLKLTSSAFQDGGTIPPKYTCDGDDVNPPLKIDNVPDGTESLALIADDPDAPMGTWVHWIVWNIDPSTTEVSEDTVPGSQGVNSWRRISYGGPCPPSGTHRYLFKLHALDTKLNLDQTTTKDRLLEAMEGHILAQTQLTGKYQRQ